MHLIPSVSIMRFLLALLFFLHITLSIAAFFPLGAGEAAGDAASGSAGAAGKSASQSTHEGYIGDDGSDSNVGCTIYSCPYNGGTSHPDSSPGGNTGSSDDGSDHEGLHIAAEVLEKINDVLDGIQSINSLATSTSDSATLAITSKAPLPTAAHPCLSAQSIYSSCQGRRDQSPSFTDRPVSQQASCLCYRQIGSNSGGSSGSATATWVPGLFDGYVSSCDAFVASQTVVSVSANVTGAGASVGATGICASVGDVRAGAVVSASSTTTTTTATSSPSNTNTVANPEFTGGAVGRERGGGLGLGGWYGALLLLISTVILQ